MPRNPKGTPRKAATRKEGAPDSRQPVAQKLSRLDDWAAEAEAAERQKKEKEYRKVTVYVHPKIATKVREIGLARGEPANSIWLEGLRRYLEQAGAGSFEEIIHAEN